MMTELTCYFRTQENIASKKQLDNKDENKLVIVFMSARGSIGIHVDDHR